MQKINTNKNKDFVKLSEEWFDNQTKVYGETDTLLYSKYGKISCKNIYDYLSDKEYESLLDVGCACFCIFEKTLLYFEYIEKLKINSIMKLGQIIETVM